jgi:peroxiredoxin
VNRIGSDRGGASDARRRNGSYLDVFGDAVDDWSEEAPLDASGSGSDDEPAPGGRSRSWRWLLLVVLAVALGVGVGFGVQKLRSGDDGASSNAAATETTTLDVTTSGLGWLAPRVMGKSLDGAPMTLAPGDGTRHAVVFLAHWCPQCQREVRKIVELAEQGELEGIAVEAVVTGTSPERPNYPPAEWLQREAWPYPALVDNDEGAVAEAYGVSAIPVMFLVDGDATVLAQLSDVDSPAARRALRAFAAGKPITGS